MTLNGEGAVFRVGKNTTAIRIPILLAKDSSFPFQVGEEVTIKIQDNGLTVQKKEAALKQTDEILAKQ